jgi:hypothetical protein
MASILDIMRQDAFRKRKNGVPGGNRALWSDKDLIKIYDKIESARSDEIVRAPQPAVVKVSDLDLDKASLAKMGIQVRSDIGSEDHPVCILSTPRVDLVNDTNNTANVETADFIKFASVLDTHDSSKPPVALSTRPWLSGTSLLAIAKFPKPGISADSDRIAAAVRAGLQRGISIGFIPLSWSFSKDPARPLGVDFNAIKLLEWSFCAQPCNQDCRVIGSVSGATTPSPDASKMADLRREARLLAAKARSLSESIPSDPAPTRDQRLAEARGFRRAADLAGRP